MADAPPISPDLPELRLLAQLASVKPSALAAAVTNPEYLSKHLSADELARYLSSANRVVALIARINTILNAELDRTLRANPALKRRMKAKGLRV